MILVTPRAELSDTAALTMLWTDPALFPSAVARSYVGELELSAGVELRAACDAIWDGFPDVVNNRKYCMLRVACDFLTRAAAASGQVLILAAGLGPLSAELSARFPDARIFDVDIAQMDLKRRLLGDACPRLRFITADLADPAGVMRALQKAGWQPDRPALVLLEGIIYYLPLKVFERLLRALRGVVSELLVDYHPADDQLDQAMRRYGDAYLATIQRWCGLGEVVHHTPGIMRELLSLAGLEPVHEYSMRELQLARSGKSGPFPADRSGFTRILHSAAR